MNNPGWLFIVAHVLGRGLADDILDSLLDTHAYGRLGGCFRESAQSHGQFSANVRRPAKAEAGRIPHNGKAYEGQHPAIIEPARWDLVQAMLKENSVNPRGPRSRKTAPSPLAGKLFDERGGRLSPSHANKKGKRYRYYISHDLIAGKKEDAKGRGWRMSLDTESESRRSHRPWCDRWPKRFWIWKIAPSAS